MSTTPAPGEQQSLTDALQAAAADDSPTAVTDDRVVTDGLTCACGRPAGADGQCTACRRKYAGEAIGNHGGRL